ncbi:MAG: DUF2459 domain-containing protein [Gammaproteobacteria bacterium]
MVTMRMLAAALLLLATSSPSATARDQPVYVVAHGWHAGLLLPAASLTARLPGLQARFPDAHYVEIGWGDYAYYHAEHSSPSLALRALFASGGSAFHLVAVPDTTAFLAGSTFVATCLSPNHYEALVEHIADGFARDTQGEVAPLASGLYGDSQFFRSTVRYGLFNTCNKWTADALGAAGLQSQAWLRLTPGSVLRLVRGQAQDCGELIAPDR